MITATEDFKPGDLPPEGYLAWHAWADVQRRAKIKQVLCPHCCRWKTPQELSTVRHEWTGRTSRGQEIKQSALVCTKCVGRDAPANGGA